MNDDNYLLCFFSSYYLSWAGLASHAVVYFLPEPVFLTAFWTALPPVVRTPFWTPVLWAQFELPYTLETNNISIIIDIEEVLRINDKDYSITFSTYFNVEWKEKDPKIVVMKFSVCFFYQDQQSVLWEVTGRKVLLINLFKKKSDCIGRHAICRKPQHWDPEKKLKDKDIHFLSVFFYSKESSPYFSRAM